MEAYLTVKEVALFLKLSVQTIRRYTMKKEIPFHKINRTVRYKKSEIELWVEKQEKAKDKDKTFEADLFVTSEAGGEV